MRIATYHTELSRKGPGLLLRDILKGDDAQVLAVADVITAVDPDILVLQGVDYDHGLATLSAFRDVVAEKGAFYTYLYASQPNAGLQSGHDLDGDGRLGEPEDAHSYGWFSGEGGQAILSKYKILSKQVRHFNELLWSDTPDPLWPPEPMPGQAVQRLSRMGHLIVPVEIERSSVTLMTFHATAPVFDGPEDRNGRRNHDEILFWRHFLDGTFGTAPEDSFVIAGNANLDPVDGDGRKAAITSVLQDRRLQDVEPRRPDAGYEDADHKGDPLLDTVSWPYPGPGSLRVSYVLPSADIEVEGAGVYWPVEGSEAEAVDTASRHRMVWVDLNIPD